MFKNTPEVNGADVYRPDLSDFSLAQSSGAAAPEWQKTTVGQEGVSKS
jgi:hypothetical protein